jgi:hypothetical protein
VTFRRKLSLIALGAFVLRAVWVLHSDNGQNSIKGWGDDGAQIALNMLAGRGYVYDYAVGDVWRSFRMPGLPLFLFGLWKLVGFKVVAAKLAMSAVSAAGVLLVGLLARRLYDERTGLVAAIIWTVFPNSIFHAATLGGESLAITLMLATVLLLVEKRWGWAGLACAGLIYIRPVYYPYAALLTGMLYLRPGARLPAARAFALAGGLAVSPWLIRNFMIHKALVPTSTEGGMTFAAANCPTSLATDGTWRPEELFATPGLDALARELGEVRFDRAMFALGRRNIAANPAGFVRSCFQRMWYIWRPVPRTGPGSTHGAFQVVVMALTWCPLFLLSVWLVWRRRLYGGPNAPIMLAIAATTVFNAPVNGVMRYRAPVEAFFAVYAAAALLVLFPALRSRPK